MPEKDQQEKQVEAEKEAAKLAEEQKAEQQEEIRKAEEARIRAEGERDALVKAIAEVRSVQSGQQANWSEEQWNNFKDQYGITREQATIHASIAQNQINAAMQSIETRVKAAEERAARAEEKLAKAESDRSFHQAKKSYIAKKPELAGHEKELDEFMGQFPESDRNDPSKSAKLLEMGETYIRGKVGAMKSRTSQRLERNDGGEEEETEIDFSGFSDSEARTIRSISPKKEDASKIKDLQMLGGRGIVLKADDEFASAEKNLFNRK